MKRVFGILLAMLVLMTGVALAEQPGDTVVVSISITNPNGATSASIGFKYDSTVLRYEGAKVTYGGISMAPGSANGSFVVMDLDGLSAKEVGKLTFTVLDGAAPGTYRVTPVLKEAIDITEQPVGSMGLRGGSVTIECNHHWVVENTTPATCQSYAATNYKCDKAGCSATKTEYGTEFAKHVWDAGNVTTAPTCCAEGVKTFKCTTAGCTKTYTESIPATGKHVYDNGTVTTAPTCCAEGVKTFKCTTADCTASYTKSVPATGKHVYDKGTVTTAPTCCAEGVKTFKCTTAGCTASYTESVPATGKHVYDKGTVTTAPTCCAEGVKTFKCTTAGCTESYTESIPATGKHVYDTGTVTTAPTCCAEGVKTFKCTTAGCTASYTESVPATGKHVYDKGTVTTAPTCCAEGVKTFKCTTAGCTASYTESVPATGKHVYDNGTVTTAPTCCAEGVKTFKCTTAGCTASYTESVPATGKHVYDKGTVTTAPTCCAEGVKTFKCTTAGCTASYTAVVPANGHDYETIDSKSPTCTKKGYYVLKCTACDDEVKQTRNARGHQYGVWTVIQSATESTAAKEQRVCSACGHTQTREIADLVDYSVSAYASGLYFRDVIENVTELSEMFAVIDLSVDGETTFELVAADAYVIGSVTITVAEGQVTVAYELVNEEIKLNNAFLTFLTDLNAVTSLEKEQLTAYDFVQPISIKDQLNGATTVMLYVDLSVEFSNDTVGLYHFEANEAYQTAVEDMLAMLGIEE